MAKRKWSAAARSATVKSAPATRIVPTAAAARGTRHAGNAAIATTTGIAAITGTTVGNTTEEEDAAAREGADGIVPVSYTHLLPASSSGKILHAGHTAGK